MYTFLFLYIYIYLCTYINMDIYLHKYVYIYLYIYVFTYVHLYKKVRFNTPMFSYSEAMTALMSAQKAERDTYTYQVIDDGATVLLRLCERTGIHLLIVIVLLLIIYMLFILIINKFLYLRLLAGPYGEVWRKNCVTHLIVIYLSQHHHYHHRRLSGCCKCRLFGERFPGNIQ
jgi:hypothetical protein